MKVKEFIALAETGTQVLVRDRATGVWLKDENIYNDREVVQFYAKSHRCGNPPKIRAQIVVFVR